MIDIHTHILYGVDDGSDSLDESLQMADLAARSGTRVLVATPHANHPYHPDNYYNTGICKAKFRRLQEAVARYRIPVELVLGMEIFGLDNIGSLIEDRALISLNHSGYYLVEFPFDMHPDEMWDGVAEILRLGGKPLIAHPERYFCIQDEPNILYDWMRGGAYSQVNRGSFFGRFGKAEERTAHQLLEHGMVTCVASDAHGVKSRAPFLKDVHDFLADQYSEDLAWKLLSDNPDRILLGKKLVRDEMSPVPRKRFFSM